MESGFDWAGTELERDPESHEVVSVASTHEDPLRSLWIALKPEPGSTLEATLDRLGLVQLDGGHDFSEGFIEGVVGAWCADQPDD